MARDLLDYLPPILREVRELRAVTEAEQPELDNLWAATANAFSDQFVADAMENGVARWEKMLRLTPKATENLEARRFKILTRLTEQRPYSLAGLKRQLAALCGANGYEVIIDNENYSLKVWVALTAKSNFEAVGALLKRVAPANLLISYSLKYNQHSILAGFTNARLAAYTYDQLRNEVVS